MHKGNLIILLAVLFFADFVRIASNSAEFAILLPRQLGLGRNLFFFLRELSENFSPSNPFFSLFFSESLYLSLISEELIFFVNGSSYAQESLAFSKFPLNRLSFFFCPWANYFIYFPFCSCEISGFCCNFI